jgi:hypothetical protein
MSGWLRWPLILAGIIPLGAGTVTEYKVGNITIHYLVKSGHLDVWRRRKVLTVDRWAGTVQVSRYVPGTGRTSLREQPSHVERCGQWQPFR